MSETPLPLSTALSQLQAAATDNAAPQLAEAVGRVRRLLFSPQGRVIRRLLTEPVVIDRPAIRQAAMPEPEPESEPVAEHACLECGQTMFGLRSADYRFAFCPGCDVREAS